MEVECSRRKWTDQEWEFEHLAGFRASPEADLLGSLLTADDEARRVPWLRSGEILRDEEIARRKWGI